MTDEIISSTADDAGEPTRAVSRSTETTSQPTDAPTPRSGWMRRAFFYAVALGAAAFLPSIGWAQDLSTNPCTGNDVVVLGNGIVLNEPCSQNGTFDAMVAFTVQNNSSASRYC